MSGTSACPGAARNGAPVRRRRCDPNGYRALDSDAAWRRKRDNLMKVLRVSFVGTRTQNFDATQALFRDALGMEAAFSKPDWAGFTLPSGPRDLVEVFGPGMTDERVAPAGFESGVLIAFAVDDIASARAELAAARVELVGDIVWARDLTGGDQSNRWGWFFFRAPDGNIYVIQQDGLPESASARV